MVNKIVGLIPAFLELTFYSLMLMNAKERYLDIGELTIGLLDLVSG
jgi:hypothetical protein